MFPKHSGQIPYLNLVVRMLYHVPKILEKFEWLSKLSC